MASPQSRRRLDLFAMPVGVVALFLLKSVLAAGDVSLREIFISVLPFIGLQICDLVLVMLLPDIALWLPRLLD